MKFLKRFIKVILAWPPLWRLVTARRWRNRVIVLMYHRVDADSENATELTISQFRLQLDWLQKTCDVITPAAFPGLASSTRLEGRPRVLLTFDDAFVSVRDRVYPELKARGLQGLVFVPSEPVIEHGTIWPQWHHDLFLYGEYESLPSFETRDSRVMPKSEQERKEAEQQVRKRLKKMNNRQRQDALAALACAANWDNAQLHPESRIMSWDDLRACADVFTYGGHTHTHPIMASVSADAQRLEVQTCAEYLHRELGVAPFFFAYPNGEQGDYNDASLAALREAGYRFAFTTQEGLHRLGDNSLTIKRLPTWAPTAADLAWIIATAD
ncbi:MAG: polysaccharide deacetylase family protein [Alcanivoracaceae bacterium]|nr:polysaccharide deacetylase family protein [Alcanivoracaceae bacterium]